MAATALRREDILTALEAIGQQADEAIDLGEAALLLAAFDTPDNDLAHYRRHLALLAADLDDAVPGGSDAIEERAAALQKVIAGQHGYEGDRKTYDDLANANLMRVIDRKRGLPVAIGILYLHTARALGWRAAGINFPGHFLIAVEDDVERIILDPFDGGAQVDEARLRQMLQAALGVDAELREEYYSSMTNRGVLLRLQNNIKKRTREAGDPDHAARIVEGMLAIAPEISDLWREAAELRAETGNLRSALNALDRFLLLSDDTQRSAALDLRRHLVTRIN